ncbi:hypothetical protein WOLCODRAFT_137920 [Wolfiporia cocos MD-104 SS10]|uniref:SH3 domain-containing protein n=1 Tax=Wolfiporia cocos (strain MD-104) TaxID=742152 RepID=A0A2H3JJU0_WOLCO|nr:hypothetical protein WOLCODRAFT_137920 [Wolfiporia cocos MD-104 SS10]
MAPNGKLVARDSYPMGTVSASTLKSDHTMIAGVVVACVIVAGGALWLGIHFLRKRRAAKRESERQAAFIPVRGVVRETQQARAPSAPQMRQAGNIAGAQPNTSVAMPERAMLRKDATREEIIEYYRAEGTLPRPFAPYSPKAQQPQPPRSSGRPTSSVSWISAGFRNSGSSSRRSSTASSLSAFDEGHKRKVRQLFNPTLPDELVLRLGEQVSVVQSFDDGWCIVGRDSVFKPGEAELGAVPAWVFVKPVKGLKAERPIRTSSLGVTVTLNNPGAPREDVISWSNFS